MTRTAIAKDPNFMGAWPENERIFTFEIDGDQLQLTGPNRRTFTLRRIEGLPSPWEQ